SYKPGHYRMIKADKREDIVVIASEPLTFEKADWLTIPTNSVVVITSKMNVLMYPIMDEFYTRSPLSRAQEESTVAVVKGEGRDDGARDQRHREVVFVKDNRPRLEVKDGSNSSSSSTTATPVLPPLPSSKFAPAPALDSEPGQKALSNGQHHFEGMAPTPLESVTSL
ncbi:hypothetical protein CPB97_004031, partial [Podila verticillata]